MFFHNANTAQQNLQELWVKSIFLSTISKFWLVRDIEIRLPNALDEESLPLDAFAPCHQVNQFSADPY